METKEKSVEDINNFWQQQFEEPITDEAFLAQLENVDLSEMEESFAESNGDKLIKALKGLCLFLPGTFLLFLFAYGLFFVFFSFGLEGFPYIKGVLWLLLAGFMVTFGIGDIKKPKYFAIPLSIFGLAFLTYFFSLIFSDGSPSFIGFHAIYLFPLILVTPILTKMLLGNTDEKIK